MADYDLLLGDEEKRMRVGASAGAVDYEGLISSHRTLQRSRVSAAVSQAAGVSPDTYAKDVQVARGLGAPVAAVETMPEDARRQLLIDKTNEYVSRVPALGRKMADPHFAKLAHDDLDNLEAVSGTIKPSTGPAPSLGSIVQGIIKSVPQGLEATRQGLRQQFADIFDLPAMKADAARKGASVAHQTALSTPQIDSWVGEGVYGGLVSTVQQAPALAASVITRSPVPGLANAGIQSEAQAYTKYRARGASPVLAGIGALGEGAVEVLTEAIPMAFLTKKLGKAAVGEFLTGLLAREIPGEQIATLVQDAIDTAVANPDKTWAQYAAERPEAAVKTLVATITQAGVTAGAGAGVKKLADMRPDQANQNAEALEQLTKLVGASKVMERDPSTMAAYIDDAASDGPVQNIQVSAAVFLQAAGEKLPEIAASMPSVAAQMQEALATGGELVIPLGEFTTGTVAHGLEQALIDHVRTAPDAMTRDEAKTFMQSGTEELQQQAEKILAEKEVNDAFTQSATKVESDLLAQLKAANRFTDDVNLPYAKLAGALYTVQAARLNITPEEMYARYPLRVAAESVAGEQQMDQHPRVSGVQDLDKLVEPAVPEGMVRLYRGGQQGAWYSAEREVAEHFFFDKMAGVQRLTYVDVTEEEAEVFAEAAHATNADIPAEVAHLVPPDVQQRESVLAEFDASSSVFEQSATIRRGSETLKKYGLKPNERYTVRQVAVALEARQRRKYGMIGRDNRSGEASSKIARWMVEEVMFEMQHPEQSGVGWYSDKFQRAIDTFAQEFPELLTDRDARSLFTALVAVTSDGQAVYGNFVQAADLYSNYKATGQFTTERGHARGISIEANVARITELLERLGPTEMHTYLLEEITVSELNKIARAKGLDVKSDYQAHIKLPRAALEFGPKLGAFYANLMGASGYLTMDRWWSRTFNRYRGTLVAHPTKVGVLRLKELLGDPAMSDEEALAATVPLRKAYEKKKFKNGTELEMAANTIYKFAFENLEDKPFGPKDRTFMVDSVQKAQKILARKGVDMSIADIQATLWYYEKRLYGELGARQSADTSFEETAKRVVGERSSDLFRDGRPAAEGAAEPAAGGEVSDPGDEEFTGPTTGLQRRGAGGSAGLAEAQAAAARAAQGAQKLNGLPDQPLLIAGDWYVPGPVGVAHTAARAYLDNAGIPYAPPRDYANVDTDRASRIAKAFGEMKHAPKNPEVRAAYKAMIDETLAQWQAIKATGLKVEFIRGDDPYSVSPRQAIMDVVENNHLWVFPTDSGFGSSDLDVSDNPLLALTDEVIDGHRLRANDVFRIVHDYFGHIKDGNGFRAGGEENAWRSHAAMYTPLARRAMTTETRGQNSWVNYGPHGEKNRTASAADTVYADQKIGLLPEWVSEEGRGDNTLEQSARGNISFANDITQAPSTITLLANADLSTFVHELGHFQLEVLAHIASQPNAPPEIVADMDRLLKWFDVPGSTEKERLTNWLMLALEEKRPMHEQLARGFEAYIFEGNAPTVALDGVFARMRAWMINVYRQLTALNVELTDEVRGVFDRMIATNEQILEAQAQRGYAPLFKSAAEMGATEAEWKAYQEQDREQTQDAINELQSASLRDMRWTSNTRVKTMRKLQAQADELRKGIEAEVRAEVRQQPIYAVQRFLRYGELPEGDKVVGAKLDLAAMKEMYGESPAAPWRYLSTGEHGLAGNEGLHPDVVASMFGFTSGDHLVREILSAEPEATVVEGLTDRRMLERHGELADQNALERATDAAIHNDVRARFIATELRALEKATAPGKARTLAKAAKAFAEAIVARKLVRDVKPAQYSAAEARAGRAAEKASNLVEKVTEKRNQLVNHYAARAAHAALEDVKKGLDYLKALDSAGTRKRIDPEYLDQIDQLLERFDLRTGQSLKAIDKRTALAAWIKSQEDMGFEPTISDELRNEAFRKSFKDMTVEEVRGLIDAVRNIEHLGRLKKKLLTAKDNREFDAVVSDIAATITDNAKKTLPQQRASDRGFLVSMRRLFRAAAAIHRKFASLVRGFDGYKDGGVAWERLVRVMNERGDFEAVENEKATVALTALLTPVLKAGKLTQKQYFADSGKSFTREERIGIALNMGNAINRERVMEGEHLTAQQLASILDTLTHDDWKFVQGVWDYFDTFRPQIGAKEKRVSGTEPEWVEAEPINTKFGQFKGGYYPIAYDPVLSERSNADVNAEVQRQIQQGLYTRAQTRRGHTKARVESTGRTLRYDFGEVISRHVSQVIHDLAWHEYLIDANRLLRAGAIENAVRDHYGVEVISELKDTLRDIAVGANPAEKGAKFWNHLRYGTTIAGLAFNVFNTLQNLTGVTQSMSRIGTKWVLKGAAHWAGDAARFEGSVAQIHEKSDFMRLRAKTMLREINDIRNKVSGKDSKLHATYFWLQQKTQLVVDVPTWWGAYEKAMSADGMTEDTAIALADQAVIDAQGSGQIKDLSGIQRGHASLKLLTTFYSFFNTTLNLTAEAAGRTNFKKPGEVALFAADLVLLYTLPALLSTLLKAALSGDWDDEEKLVKKIIGDQISFMLGTIVGLREASTALQAATGTGEGFGYTGPAGMRLFGDLAKLGKQAAQGEADEAFWKALNNVGGVVFHYPAGQINRTASGIAALADGRTSNPGALLMGAPRD